MKLLISSLMIFFISGCSQKAEKSGVRIKIATYNVHNFTGGYGPVKKTIEGMGPDIIALQEVLVKGGTDYSRRLANELRMYLAVSRPYVIFNDRKWVLSFLSRYPIKRKEEIRLGKYRRALKVIVDIESRPAAFSTMHLSPFIWDSKNLLSANWKRSRDRVDEINDLIRWFKRAGRPEVVMGDFNIPGIMPGMDLLYEYGYRNVLVEADNSVSGTYRLSGSVRETAGRSLRGFKVPQLINLDYILVSGTIKVLSVMTVDSDSSDHLPLSAEIELRKPEGE